MVGLVGWIGCLAYASSGALPPTPQQGAGPLDPFPPQRDYLIAPNELFRYFPRVMIRSIFIILFCRGKRPLQALLGNRMTKSEGNPKTFGEKVSQLVSATNQLDVPRTLLVRRMTIANPESTKWASADELKSIFDVIVGQAMERLDPMLLEEARLHGFEPLVPKGSDAQRAEDAAVLTALAGRFAAAEAPEPEEKPAPLPVEPEPILVPEKPQFVTFDSLFDSVVCQRIRKNLQPWGVEETTRTIQLPFLVSPHFPSSFELMLRTHIFPVLRATRHIQLLSMTYNWNSVGGEKLDEIMAMDIRKNPVLFTWDNYWNKIRAGLKDMTLNPAENPLTPLCKDARSLGYSRPTDRDVMLLQSIIHLSSSAMSDMERGLMQAYEQEFDPPKGTPQAREGALRDLFLSWFDSLPMGMGDFLAIRLYFACPLLDTEYMRKLLTNFGENRKKYEKNVPYLTEFVDSL